MNVRKEYIRETEAGAAEKGWMAMGQYYPAGALALKAVQDAALERNRNTGESEAMLIQWVPNSIDGFAIAQALAARK